MSEYPRTEEFFKETVEPTVDEYHVRPDNIRRGRLAAIVLNHMVDYWHEDTQESLTAIRATLRADTLIPRYPNYSSSDILWDLADASKHARLEPFHNGRRRQLIDAGQIEPHLSGAVGTAVVGTVPVGMAISTDLRVTLNNGQSFMLSYAIRNVAEVWHKKLGLL